MAESFTLTSGSKGANLRSSLRQQRPDMVKKKILVVDDEASITRLLKLNLEKGAYVVRTENEGTKALAAAKDFKPDLILLDVMMPDIDGGDVAAIIQADPLLCAVPIVFLTAAVKKEEVEA